MEHKLRIDCELYPFLESGAKTCEFRRDDREYQREDILVLQEWLPTAQTYSGKEFRARITDVRHGGQYGIPDGYVVLSIIPEWNKSPMLRGAEERQANAYLHAVLKKIGSVRLTREELNVVSGAIAMTQTENAEIEISFHESK